MAKSFSIEAIFKAVDRMTAPISKMTRSTKTFSQSLKTDFAKAQRQVDRFARNFKQQLGRNLRRVALGIGLAVVAGLGLAAKEFVDFQQTATNAAAKFGSTAEEFERIKMAAREFAAVTQFNAVEAAAGLEFFAKAGFTADEAMGSLKSQIDLATVAGQDLQATMDITSDLLSSLGLASDDSAEKIKNLDNLTNSLGLAVNMANVDLNDLFETLKVAGPIATAAGEDMNSLIAITAGLGGAGIKGSMAATALKNAYVRLAAPTDKVTDALKQLGLVQSDFIDDQGDMKSMVDIMSQLGAASSDLGGAQRLGIFSEIFGKNAVAGATNLANSLSEIDVIFQKLESDARISAIADQIRNGLGMQVKILKSGLLELGFKFIEAFEEKGAGALSKLIEAVQNFDMAPLIEGAKKAFNIISKFVKFVKLFAPIIVSVIALVAAFYAYQAALFVAAWAQGVFNTVMSANPIGLVIIAIGLLVGAIIWMVKNWDLVKAALLKVWTVMKNFAIDMWNRFMELLENPFFVSVGLLVAPWIIFAGLIIKHWDKVKEFFISMWSGIKIAFNVTIDFMKGALFTFADLILTTFGNIFKSIIIGASAVGKFFGFDTTELDNVVEKINAVQATVRAESFIGGRESEVDRIRASREAPIGPSERSSISREEAIQRSEVTIRDESGRAEITGQPSGSGFGLNLQQSGGFE